MRRALTMALDRDLLIDSLLGGLGQRITGPFHPQSPQYDDDIQPFEYNLDRARDTLSDNGWNDTDGDGIRDKDLDGDGTRESLTLEFLVPSSDLGRQIQRYVLDQCAAIGVNVTLDAMDWSMYQQRVTRGDFEMIMQRSTGKPELDPFEYWHSSQIDGGRNYVGYADAQVDVLIEQARRELDPMKRMELWHGIHRQLHDAQPQTFLWTTPRLMFVSRRVHGVTPRSLRLYTSEWYIPADER